MTLSKAYAGMSQEISQDQAAALLSACLKGGADAAEVIACNVDGREVRCLNGKDETLEASLSCQLSLRVLCGKRQGIATTNNPENLEDLVEKALGLARIVPEDPFCGLAPPDLFCVAPPALDLCDTAAPSFEALRERALEAEAAALAVNGVSGSLGACAGWSRQSVLMMTSLGFSGQAQSTHYGLGVGALAGTGDSKKQDFYSHSAVFQKDLESPSAIGTQAGQRAASRLNPRAQRGGRLPVLYEDLIAPSLIRIFIQAISGNNVARKTTFLGDQMGQAVFSKGITLTEDPFLPRAFGTRTFDGEGLPVRKRNLVEGGVLQTWLLNLRYARQLGLTPTGHATFALGSSNGIAPGHILVQPGEKSTEDLMREMGEGFLVTDLLGSYLNLVRGEYSLGARGFWIQGGEKAYPVEDMALAGNLATLFKGMTPASARRRQGAVTCPALLVEGLTVGGG